MTRESPERRIEAGAAVCVEPDCSARRVLPDQVDHRLEELEQRFWLAYASADDHAVVLSRGQRVNNPSFSRRVQRDQTLIGGQIGVVKPREAVLQSGANGGGIDSGNGVGIQADDQDAPSRRWALRLHNAEPSRPTRGPTEARASCAARRKSRRRGGSRSCPR